MKRVTVMHSFAGMLVVLLLSLLLRGMCLYVRVMGLRLLTHSDCLPPNSLLEFDVANSLFEQA